MSEHTQVLEWLDLEVEGELAAPQRRRLADHLAHCDACAAERRRLVRLREALDDARVPVRADFRSQVMAALPPAGWQPAPAAVPRRSLLAAALGVVALALASALLLTTAAAGGTLPGLGVLAALAELTAAALVTGAGLLGASWSGVGLALGEVFGSAPGVLVGFTLLLALLSLLLVSLLRRPRPAAGTAHRDGD
jgi:anti-sigma factor RsiW